MKNCRYVHCSPFLHLPAFNFSRGWILTIAVTSAEGPGATLVPQAPPSTLLLGGNPFCKAKCTCWAGFLPNRVPGAQRENSRRLFRQLSKVLSLPKQKTWVSWFLFHPRSSVMANPDPMHSWSHPLAQAGPHVLGPSCTLPGALRCSQIQPGSTAKGGF